MDRQTLRDWVHRYNQQGVDGLISRKAPVAGGKLTEAQMSEVRQWVLDGPDPAIHKVIRWRCVYLCGEVERRFAVSVAKRTMVKWLRKWRFTRLQPRPYHPKKDAAAQEAFKKRMARPARKRFLQSDLSSLRQRIRPMGAALAKMEIRAPWSS
jgi:transposase